jgi:hypothetical protein
MRMRVTNLRRCALGHEFDVGTEALGEVLQEPGRAFGLEVSPLTPVDVF